MPLPRPAPGMVVRYGFLWSDGAEAGRSEARKSRACFVVVVAVHQSDGRVRLRAVPGQRRVPRTE